MSGVALGTLLADELGLFGWERWLFISAISIAGAAIGAILGPYVAKLGSVIGSSIHSGLVLASIAANRAIEQINSFSVSAKHLADSGGRYAKFITNSMEVIRQWVVEALSSSEGIIYPNTTDNSYYIITDMGREIGTKGERFLKVVFDSAGKIWTAFPVQGPK